MPNHNVRRNHPRPISLRRLLIATAALPAATLAVMLAFASEAGATAIDYTLDGAVINGNGSLHVSGGFTYDPITHSESNVSTNIVGTYSSFVVNGLYTQAPPIIPSDAVPDTVPTIEAGVGSLSAGAEAIGFSFTGALGDSPDGVSAVGWRASSTSTCSGHLFYLSGTISPGIVVDPIPEPSSIALPGSAFGLFLRRRRASRRGGSPSADRPRAT